MMHHGTEQQRARLDSSAMKESMRRGPADSYQSGQSRIASAPTAQVTAPRAGIVSASGQGVQGTFQPYAAAVVGHGGAQAVFQSHPGIAGSHLMPSSGGPYMTPSTTSTPPVALLKSDIEQFDPLVQPSSTR